MATPSVRAMSSPAITMIPGESPAVLGQDAETTLSWIAAERKIQDSAAARQLVQVAHWADLHRADLPPELAAESREAGVAVEVPATGWSEELGGPLRGAEAMLQLAGEGTYAITEFAVCEVATALGMSETAARAYVGQTIELRDRLPRCWAKVMAGKLPAWKARQIAAETIALNPAAAAYVDAHLAPFAHKLGLRAILRTVAAAILRHDRPLAAERAAKAAEKRGVWLDDRLDGTTEVSAVVGTPDASAFNHTLNRVAAALRALGDLDPHQVRRAKGIGVLADPQYALDLTTTAEAMPLPDSESRTPVPDMPPRAGTAAPTIHVHLHTAAVTGTQRGGELDPVADIAGYGPRTVESVGQWLRDLAPRSTVKLTPVVDLTTTISTDGYHPTAAQQAQVAERDACCVFPWCGQQGRYDLDHIIPFVPPDEGGPPGQTNTENLARLCRFHHRVKTHGGWTYRREPGGSLTWTSPYGRTYRVDRTGTVPLS